MGSPSKAHTHTTLLSLDESISRTKQIKTLTVLNNLLHPRLLNQIAKYCKDGFCKEPIVTNKLVKVKHLMDLKN